MSPTARTLANLRAAGYLAEVVERFNSFTKRRNDLFGFIDVVAIAPNQTVGIQTTTTSNLAARRKKILDECREAATAWIAAGNRIVLHGWSKRPAKPGSKSLRWTVRAVEITAEDF